jgi:hypothetical protein
MPPLSHTPTPVVKQANPPDTYTEWDGTVYEFSGEWSERTCSSRRVAARNRTYWQSPVYIHRASGKIFVPGASQRPAQSGVPE